MHLSPSLKRSPSTYVRTIRWCPACLGEQEIEHGSAYLKLTWFLEGLKTCATHRILLRDRCPSCNRLARPVNRWASFTACQHCAARLDRVSVDDVIEPDPQSAAPDLVRFVADLVHRSSPFPEGAVNRYVDKLFNEAWASERELALWEKLPRDDCLRYASASEPVTLPAARRIAYLLEVPISELLEGEPPSIRSFGFAAEQSVPQPMLPSKRGPKVDTKAIEEYLLATLDAGAPTSLRQAARNIGTTVGAMRYHFPGLVNRLSLFCKAHLAAELNRNKVRAREATFSGIHTWRRRHTEPLSRKGLLADLMKETGLPKNVLREAIQQWWLPALTALEPQESSRTAYASQK